MRKLDWPTIGILFLWIVVGIWMLIYSKAEAQDNPITVCRREGYYNPIRLEFHNIPANWFVWNDATAPSWGYWAEGVAMGTESDVLLADALMVDTDGYLAGTAVLVDYTDNWTLVGGENTPECDAPIEPTATPEPEPPVVQQVVSQAVVSTGKTCTIKYPEIILVCNG